MKKLVFLFLSLLTAGSLFQACDDSKTYAEQLEDEKNAVERFIKDSAIHVISVSEFEQNDSVTKAKANGDAYDEFVFFSSEGVYMQIIDRGCGDYDDSNDPNRNNYTDEEKEEDKFVDGNNICTRYAETSRRANWRLSTFLLRNIWMPEHCMLILPCSVMLRQKLTQPVHLRKWIIYGGDIMQVPQCRKDGFCHCLICATTLMYVLSFLPKWDIIPHSSM